MGSLFCPKCDSKLPTLDGKKVGGIPGNKYRVCLPCKVVVPVKHRIYDPAARKRKQQPRGGPIATR